MVEPALQVSGLSAWYGATPVLREVSFSLLPGEVLLVLGRNGSGRSTLLKAIMGLISSQGSVRLQGLACEHWPTHQRVRQGLGYVPETRDIFPTLTVEQNLNLGLWQSTAQWPPMQAEPSRNMPGWEVLRERRSVPAGSLSGGEQQMLSLARTLVAQPRVVLADEPTEGLAPQRVEQVAQHLQATVQSGTAWVLVEQKLQWALPRTHRVLVLGRGQVVFEGSPAQLQAHRTVWQDWILS